MDPQPQNGQVHALREEQDSTDSTDSSNNPSSFDVKSAAFLSTDDWKSEKKIVSALAILQDLEDKLQHLRTLLPNRLFAPMRPLIDPSLATLINPMPQAPNELFDRLAETARESMEELDAFKTNYSSPAMRSIIQYIDERRRENKGLYPQMDFLWDVSYEALLGRMLKQEEKQLKLEDDEEQRIRDEQFRQTLPEWKSVVKMYSGTFPGLVLYVPPTDDGKARFSARLTQVAIELHFVRGVREWHIAESMSNRTFSVLEAQIIEAINGRDQKWNLPYFIALLGSFADPAPKSCTRCGLLVDEYGHLATARKSVPDEDAPGGYKWLAYHPCCLRLAQ